MSDGSVSLREKLAPAKRPGWVAPVAVWVAAAAWIGLIYYWMQWVHPEALIEGFKLRDESSDNAWQTLRLWELWKVGPEALWLTHIYPPLYDGIRWLMMQPETSAGLSPSAVAVDQRLYVMNAILFGLVAMVVYLWVRDLTRSGWWGLAAATGWSLLPASISFMTLLNQTGLAIASMAVAFYYLYRFCRTRRNVYALGFFIALLVASLTRNVLQIHVIVVVIIAAFAFWIMGRPRRTAALVMNLGLVAVILFWPVRTFVMYSTFDVSTHTGYNRAGALWINPNSVPEPVWPENIERNATALSSGWNTQETLKDNYRLGNAANDLIIQEPVEAASRVLKSLAITIPVAFRSVYVQWYNAFLFEYPLARALDWVFSGIRFAGLIVLSFLVIGYSYGLRRSLFLMRRYLWFIIFWTLTAIPVALSNRYWPPEVPEPIHSEADRLRGLIDIPIYVAMAYAAFLVVRRVIPIVMRKKPSSSSPAGTDTSSAHRSASIDC